MLRSYILRFVSAFAVAVSLPSALEAAPLTLTGSLGQAVAINNANVIVGFAQQGDRIEAWVTDAGMIPRGIGTLGGPHSSATLVSDSGFVAGWFWLPGNAGRHAFLYANGQMIDLGTLGGTQSMPLALSETGVVVGWSYLPGDTTQRAFRYSDGVMTDLGTLGGSESAALDINEAGQIAGWADTAGNAERHAVVWTGGVPADLGTLGGTTSIAAAINEAGQVAGSSYLAGGSDFHGFFHDAGMMQDIGTLGGTTSYAIAMNEAGQIVGQSSNGASHRAFLWDAGVMSDISPATPGGSYALAINSSGEAVGRYSASEPYAGHRAFRYSNGTTESLGAEAFDINDAGHAVGWSVFVDDPFEQTWYPQGTLWPGLCGNGSLDAGESCDDDNLASGDCCSTMCTVEPAGNACWPDSEPCTTDTCDGAGSCVHVFEPRAPETCVAPEKARFRIRDEVDLSRDRVDWSWSTAGPLTYEDLGVPVETPATDYTLCIYDHTGGVASLAHSFTPVPASSWKRREPKGWTLVPGFYDPVRALVLKTNADGTAKVKLKARGDYVTLPAPVAPDRYFSADDRVTVQLVSKDGLCLSSDFDAADRNEGARYEATQR